MASAVLGKRQRSAIESPATTPSRTPSKRRARAPRIHEEEGDLVTLTTNNLTPKSIESYAPQHENDTAAKDRPRCSVRSTRTVQESNSVLSPANINAQLKTSKLLPDENTNPAAFTTPTKSSRYRNALAESSPSTPKHRVQVGSKPVTPRTPRTINTVNVSQTVYSQARQLFVRSANPGRLIGRDNERAELNTFLAGSAGSRKGGCLYVSGPPGTGKSAMVDEVCRQTVPDNVKVAKVNCASMNNARDIFSNLVEDLCAGTDVFKKSEAQRLQDLFLPKKASDNFYVVTLDEVDHLLTSDLEVLYTMFEWSLQRKSHLILIGIANALDLTDRFLPRLKSKNLRPHLLPFLPYSAAQIANVITTRLQALLPPGPNPPDNFVPFLHPAAIQLCAKKVASQTGDLRKAFDLVRRAIDLIERETQQKLNAQDPLLESPSKAPLAENTNLSSPPKTPTPQRPTYDAITAPRATIAHIARVTSAAFGNGTAQRLQGLNLQQKAALCALIALARKRRNEGGIPNTPSKSQGAAPTIKQLFDTYCALCRADKILHPLTSTEFKDVMSSLETVGLVGEVHGRGRNITGGSNLARTPTRTSRGTPGTPSRSGRVDENGLVSFVGEKELETHISGPGEGILRSILNGEGI